METAKKSHKLRRTALVGILISFLTILVIFKFTETSVTWQVIFEVDYKFIIVAIFFHSLFWIFWALRLKKLSEYLGAGVSFSYSLETSLASGFLAAITPSSAGGEPLRAKMLSDAGMSVGASTAVVLAERLLDAIFFISAIPVMIFISGFSTKFGIYAELLFTAIFIIFTLFMYFSFKNQDNIQKISSKLTPITRRFLGDRRAERVTTYITKELFLFREASVQLATKSKTQILYLFLITIVIWLFEFLVPSAILLSLRTSPFWAESIASQLFLVIISLIPLTPGSSGIAETGMLYFYSLFVEKHYLGALIGIWRIVTYYSNLIVGLIINVRILKSKYLENQ